MTHYSTTRRKAISDMQARRPSRKAVQAAINAQAPLDAPPKPVEKRKVRKISDDDGPLDF